MDLSCRSPCWRGDFHDQLTANPIQYIIFRTGKAALVLLILSLACTPISTIFGLRQLIGLRKPLGLYAFTYASLHFLTFVGLDYQFDPILPSFLKKRCPGRVRSLPRFVSAGDHFNERLDETTRQEMETTASAHLSSRHPGDYSFHVVSEVRYS